MFLKRSAFAGLGAALVAALSIPIVIGVTAAGAVTTCDTGQFPKTPGGQSGLKVFCTFDAPGVGAINVIEVSGTGAGGAPLLYQTSAAHGFTDGETVTTSGFDRGKYSATFAALTGTSCTIGTAGGGDCDTDEVERAAFGSLPAAPDDLGIRATVENGGAIVYTTGSGATSTPHQIADGSRVRISGFTPSGYNGNFVIETGASCEEGSGGSGDCTASELEVTAADPGTVTTFGDVEIVFGTISDDNPVGSIVVHDAENAVWRRGAARIATITTVDDTLNTFTMASGTLGPADLNRPISHPGTGLTEIRGGTFIRSLTPAACTTACTGGTLSQLAGSAAPTTIDVIVEHTRAKTVFGRCPTPPATAFGGVGGNMEVATATFTSDDEGKSFTGGPFVQGARIASVESATRVTIDPTPFTGSNGQISCSSARPALYPTIIDRFVVGAADYGTATYPDRSTVYEETWTRDIERQSGAGYSCSGDDLNLGASGGTFSDPFDVGLQVDFIGTGADTGVISSIVDSDTADLDITCPASSTRVIIGIPSASAPAEDQAMAILGATLELNPSLVAEQDDCANGTPEGFGVIGVWKNPGEYNTPGSTDPTLTVGQVAFPTAVVSFNGYVVPVPGGDSEQSADHYDFVFPALPTSSAVCPGTDTGITLGFNPTTQSAGSTDLPSGGGNPAGPGVRALGPMLSNVSPFGDFQQVIELNDALGDPLAGSPFTSTACDITSPAPIDFGCGDG
jgi:hypothetical protein